MAVIVTDPDVALDGLCSRVDRLLGMDPAEWSLASWNARCRTCAPPACVSPGLLGRVACPQIRSLATTCRTLVLAFEVREVVMAVTVTDPDVALDGRSRVDRLLGMDPAEWTLDQPQRTRTVLNVPPPACVSPGLLESALLFVHRTC